MPSAVARGECIEALVASPEDVASAHGEMQHRVISHNRLPTTPTRARTVGRLADQQYSGSSIESAVAKNFLAA
jgi:hypothetical protein